MRLTFTALVLLVASCGGEGGVTSGTKGATGGAGGSSADGGGGDAGPGGTGTGGLGSGASGGSGGSGGSGSTTGGSGGVGGASGGGGSGGAPDGSEGDPCTLGDGDCQQDLYCDAPGCGAGTCQPVLPASAQQQIYDPLCGCDGVTYFNGTVAQSFGAAISHAGVCTANEAVACDKNSNPCATSLSCNVEVANAGMCSPTLSAGVCWGVPVTCGAGQPMARGCIPPNDCANECALIRGQNGWYEDATCQ